MIIAIELNPRVYLYDHDDGCNKEGPSERKN